jgi:mRNA-degrading endonuclease toxin of MazEF toxin-antitoxin module
MNRGDVVTVRDSEYANKARPAIVMQTDEISAIFESVILVGLTTVDMPSAVHRMRIDSSTENRLASSSYVMTEKPFTVRASRVGARIGRVTQEQTHAIAAGLASVLGITTTP